MTDTPDARTDVKADWRHAYRHPLDSYFLLLLMVSVTILLLGLVDLRGDELTDLLVTGFAGAMLTIALRTSNAPSRFVVAAGVLAAVTVIGHSVALLAGADAELRWLTALWFVLVIAAPIAVLARVLHHPKVTLETIFGVICVFLLIALAATFAFLAIAGFGRGEFFGAPQPTTSFMYFSLVTISTLGYGDLAPTGELGRMAAGFEAILGQVFLVTVVARMVSLYSGVGPLRPRERPARGTEPEESG